MPRIHTLGKHERLKRRKLVDALFKTGRNFVISRCKFYYRVEPTPADLIPQLQFGIGVSSRHFKKAVDRNRVKRLSREAYRLQNGPLKQLVTQERKNVYLFCLYMGKELPGYEEIVGSMKIAVDRLSQMIARAQGI